MSNTEWDALDPAPEPNEEIDYLDRPLDEMPEDFLTVHRYWDTLRAGRFAPTWKEFEMMKIPPTLLPSTLVKDVEHDPLTFRYRFYGTHLARIWDRELTGKTTDDLQSVMLAKTVRQALERFIEQKQPVFTLLRVSSPVKPQQLQMQLRLPISNDGINVTNVLTLISHLVDKVQFTQLLGCKNS